VIFGDVQKSLVPEEVLDYVIDSCCSEVVEVLPPPLHLLSASDPLFGFFHELAVQRAVERQPLADDGGGPSQLDAAASMTDESVSEVSHISAGSVGQEQPLTDGSSAGVIVYNKLCGDKGKNRKAPCYLRLATFATNLSTRCLDI